jgi:hypothetical protein
MAEQTSEVLQKRLGRLQDTIEELQEEVRLSAHRDRIEDITTTVDSLDQGLAELRNRGYPFEKGLEGTTRQLRERWPTLRQRVQAQVDQEALRLQAELRTIERTVQQAIARVSRGQSRESVLVPAESAAKSFVEKVEAASGMVEGMYDEFSEQVREHESHLQQVGRMLDRFAEATFRMLPGEAAIGSVRASWDRGGKDDPSGVLYLTDQRLLFEQKQEIATKKVLFVTTEKKMVHQLLLEVALGQVEAARASRKGLLGHEDHIDLELTSDAATRAAHFHLDGQDCTKWQALVGRAKAGGFDQDRAFGVDEELVNRARNAPTRCPVCNAPIHQRVLRGMDRITCDYCGHTIRI